ncbi:uncharacterized protein LOC100378962 [Saccoglossus kowalevskii]|uniref:Uncharacterized protein LOC100378962 n=1 Tax=Saccoglossus kowalevskii TaxID=10224 RepID=A0ABM0M835_SACKO|nr:PREDICTED: uncharacterized protein LOC100378962 [Saccoglossus kowalevskii]
MSSRQSGGSTLSGSSNRQPNNREEDEAVGPGGSGMESDDEYDSEEEMIKQLQIEEQNKFEMLCDGVLNSISLVNNSMVEFLDVKDELLKHALPPALLAKLTIVAGKIYRSTTDLNTPVSEMVRLVKVYSVPWEEKSAALKKLHSDYESKHKQLNIAVRRLQLIDTHSKRMEREKRIMNWEKLFAKLTSSRGHGRRWKFLIQTFREKSKMGLEYLQQYIDNMDKEEEEKSDHETEEDKKEVQSMITQSTSEDFKISSDELDLSSDSDMSDTPKPTKGVQDDTDDESFDDEDESSSPNKKVTFQEKGKGDANGDGEHIYLPAPKPPTDDKCIWTHEPEYEKYLNIRVYKPLGLDHQQLRCMVSFDKVMKKTDAFEDPQTDVLAENKETVDKEAQKETKGKSMIGSKSSPSKQTETDEHKPEVPIMETTDPDKFYLVTFPLPEETASGLETPVGNPDDNLGIAVHHGQYDEMLAMTTIDRFDLETLDIPTYDVEDEIDSLEITPFPLKSLKPSKRGPQKTGQMPLSVYYTRKLIPRTYDKESETETLHEVIKEETGIDVYTVDLDEIHTFLQRGPLEDRCLSALSLQSSIGSKLQNMVPVEDVEALQERHNEEMMIQQEEYERRLNGLARSLQEVQEAQIAALTGGGGGGEGITILHPSVSGDSKPQSSEGSRRSAKGERSPFNGWTSHTPRPPDKRDKDVKTPSDSSKSKSKGGRVSQPLPKWGSDLPKDFFERMRQFQEERIRHQQELTAKTQAEIQEHIERQMAGQYRLAQSAPDALLSTDDVCLPAVFMPTRTGQLYNPRAHHYFHASGSLGSYRLTQPPSMFQLPPLPNKNKQTAVDLFDIRRNFQPKSAEFLTSIPQTPPTQYFSMSQPMTPQTPAPTVEHSAPPTADAYQKRSSSAAGL